MTWLQHYRLRHFLRNSLWVPPVSAMILAMGSIHALHAVDRALGWKSAIPPEIVQSVLGTMAASMFTFIVFVCSALLISVQLASSSLTPRIIAMVFNDRNTRISLAVFTFTFTFSLGALVRVTSDVPALTVYVAAYSSLASLGYFLFLIDHVGKSLRPSGALRRIALRARAVVRSVYPTPLSSGVNQPPAPHLAAPSRTIPSRKFGVILAVDLRGLVALAQRSTCIVELVPQVGDFVAADDPLFRVHGNAPSLPDEAFYQSVAFGQERTLEQDPAFAVRVMVDIAIKALSPAINDPTTAVLAIDQIQHLLREVGGRFLEDGHVRDTAGQLRLVYRTPDWNDFVLLATTEIRQFGSTSIQVIRRLRAMLENLTETLPADRQPILHEELHLLDRSAQRTFPEPEDRALAENPDLQGVGGNRPESSH